MGDTIFGRIAHPTDLTDSSEFALYHALRLAVAAKSQLDILHVDPAPHVRLTEDFPKIEEILAGWQMSENGLRDRVQAIAAYGKEPIHPILSYIDESLPDLVVLATRRRQGLDRLLHQEVAQKVARAGGLPTLFVPFGQEGFVSPDTGQVHLRHVLLPVDWLPAPQVGVDTIVEMAELLGCVEMDLTLLHVGDDEKDVPAFELPDHPGWRWHQEVRSGDVVKEILDVAQASDADLIVMVTQGREGFLDALRGSTTEQVLQGAPCPVLAVPTLDSSMG